ncbi:MAG: D-alanyl-D-alanine carboxypeptidase family protein [Lapillicoccus sp.]
MLSVNAASPNSNIKALHHLLAAWAGPTTADGIAGPATMASLTSTTGYYGSPNPSTTEAVQQLMVEIGYHLDVDDAFGDATLSAVKTYQARVGLPSSKTSLSTNGIRGATCLIPDVNAITAAAARDGVTLRANSGWRSRDEQIALRRQNCGTTTYDIYTEPASQCSPATAITGTSIHEYGLAIDFSSCGFGSSRRNWLLAHGAGYGFTSTVPSESWHFDTKG